MRGVAEAFLYKELPHGVERWPGWNRTLEERAEGAARHSEVADPNKYEKGGGKTINLEREFTKKLVTLDLTDQADPMVRSH